MAGSGLSRKESRTRQLASAEFYCSPNIMLEENVSTISKRETEIEISRIKVLPQVRRDIDDDFNSDEMTDLVNSITKNGLLNPITLRRDKKTNELILVAGHRRLNAFKKMGREKIPATIIDLDETQAIFAQMSENLTRKELKFTDIAVGIRKLRESINPKTQKEYSIAELSELLGLHRMQVNRYYSLNFVDSRVLDLYESKKVQNLEALLLIDRCLKNKIESILDFVAEGNTSCARIRQFEKNQQNPQPEESKLNFGADLPVPKEPSNLARDGVTKPLSNDDQKRINLVQQLINEAPVNDLTPQPPRDDLVYDRDGVYRDKEGNGFLTDGRPVNVRTGSLNYKAPSNSKNEPEKTEARKVETRQFEDQDDDDFDIDEMEPTPEDWQRRRIVVRCKEGNGKFVIGELFYDMDSEFNEQNGQMYLWIKDDTGEARQFNAKAIEIISVDSGS